MDANDKQLYLDILFGSWEYITEDKTKIRTPNTIACDLNHPNIKRIFDKAMLDSEKVKAIVTEAFIELEK
jgi:hypothetical protein